ncbi:MAG TPA: NUDIX domain-containing protein [Gemmatimonadaceae bacterium]|nr:NUDIX domain-containing protein [Gemmatimonadaceae bacterium]
MSDRNAAPPRQGPRRVALSIDVVALAAPGHRLMTLLTRARDPRSKERWELPSDPARGEETIEEAAARIVRAASATPAAQLEQVAAFGDRRRHPAGAEVSVAFLALMPPAAVQAAQGAASGAESAWFALEDLPPVAPRHRAMIDGAMSAVRARLDQEPIAFRLLPPTFTLSQLQEVYELLVGRRLHKASFRRALQAAWLVEPTDEWRSEGRGRPAQLFRFAPRRRRGNRRGVRFDGLGNG